MEKSVKKGKNRKEVSVSEMLIERSEKRNFSRMLFDRQWK